MTGANARATLGIAVWVSRLMTLNVACSLSLYCRRQTDPCVTYTTEYRYVGARIVSMVPVCGPVKPITPYVMGIP
jgi:hypothetical protein